VKGDAHRAVCDFCDEVHEAWNRFQARTAMGQAA
jgi:hypothetical protein